MNAIKFLVNVNTLEELKALYKKLALKLHPDKGGNLEDMQQLNNEYDYLFPRLKNIHKNSKGETYEKETSETPEMWKEVINKLINLNMENVKIEVIGSFLWLSGNTKEYKDAFKTMGFKWSSNKSAWYLSPVGYKKTSNKRYQMDDIRDMFGSETINASKSLNVITA